MKLADHRDINARPDTVWTALLDPEVLLACVPGCESMTGSIADGYEAVVVQKVGPVKAKFTGIVNLSGIEPGKAVTISGEGKGGAAGFAKGGARVTLTAEGDGTRLAYEVDASVGGKLAQLGSRIIDGFAKKMANEFFTRFQDLVGSPSDTEVEAEPAGDAQPADGEDKKGWLKRVFSN